MRVDLGMKVITSDGHDVGSVKHLVLDPDTMELKSAVVEHGLINREAHMVTLEMITPIDDEQAQLRCTEAELDALPPFIASDFTSPPPGYTLPLSYPGGGLLWPIAFPTPGVPEPGMNREADAASERLQEQNLENAIIDEDSDVMSRDGEKIGEVERLSFDSTTGKADRLLIRKGFLLHKTLDLPVSTIRAVDDGIVMLNLSKEEALRLATDAEDD